MYDGQWMISIFKYGVRGWLFAPWTAAAAGDFKYGVRG